MNYSLKQSDLELYSLIESEKERQRYGIELIVSEKFTSQGVMKCLVSVLTNKYSEWLPAKRYYGGNELVDKIESLYQDRALKAFELNAEE